MQSEKDTTEAIEDTEQQAGNPDLAPEWLVNFRRSDFKRGFYVSGEGYGVVFTDRGSDVLIGYCRKVSASPENL